MHLKELFVNFTNATLAVKLIGYKICCKINIKTFHQELPQKANSKD